MINELHHMNLNEKSIFPENFWRKYSVRYDQYCLNLELKDKFRKEGLYWECMYIDSLLTKILDGRDSYWEWLTNENRH